MDVHDLGRPMCAEIPEAGNLRLTFFSHLPSPALPHVSPSILCLVFLISISGANFALFLLVIVLLSGTQAELPMKVEDVCQSGEEDVTFSFTEEGPDREDLAKDRWLLINWGRSHPLGLTCAAFPPSLSSSNTLCLVLSAPRRGSVLLRRRF